MIPLNLSKLPRKFHLNESYGTDELCFWVTFDPEESTDDLRELRVQTRSNRHREALTKLKGFKLVGKATKGGYLRIYQGTANPKIIARILATRLKSV